MKVLPVLMTILTALSLGAPPAQAANLCPSTRLTCFIEVPAVDHESICGRVLTRRRALYLLTRQLRHAAAMIDGGNFFCGTLQVLEATEFFAHVPRSSEPED